MELEQKERLARLNDMSLEATAIRLRASRKLAGLMQKEMATAARVSKSSLNNAEMGLTWPSRDVMKYLFRQHRIDFNFVMNGNFSQLPGDVQDAIFPQLAIASNEWDRRERSNRGRGEPPAKR